MVLISVIGAIKLEPSVIKQDPSAVVEIYPADVFGPSDEEEDKDKKKITTECKIDVVSEVKDAGKADGGKGNNFCSTNNLRKNEHLVINFNRQVVSQSDDDSQKEDSNSEKVNWANVYRTYETTNCLEEQRKVKTIYGDSWNKPILEEEYTRMSENSVICNHCHRELKGMRSTIKHIRVVHRESSIIHQCPYCPAQSKWDLKYHILTHHKDENEVTWFQCYQCDKKFRIKNHLARHMQEHTGRIKEKSATCPTCERVFCSRRRLRHHVKIDHKGEKFKFQCTECSFNGQSANLLTHHIEVHHTDVKTLPIHQCNKCNYKTRFKYLFLIHCKKHEFTFFCDKCSYTTHHYMSSKLHENVHKKKIDDKSLKYHCKKCDYKTYRSYSLQIHELNHLKPEEINYFYCYHCDFKAKRKDNLKTHVLRHFKKEEVTLECFMCDFKTKKRDAMTKHLNLHQKSPEIKKAVPLISSDTKSCQNE